MGSMVVIGSKLGYSLLLDYTMLTIRELLATHPDWIDLPIAVYRPDGGYDFVGDAADAYVHEDFSFGESDAGTFSVLVFAPN